MTRTNRCAAGLIAALFLSSCGTKPPEEGDPHARTARQLLGGVSEIYSFAQLKLKRPPNKPQEIEPYSRAEAFVYQPVLRGDIVVLWGANIGTGTAILAYEKDAPTKGGWVLLQDRTLKEMTADEFKTAPKAK